MGAESERTRVRPGDLLFSITAYLGSVAVVPEGFEDAYVSQHVALCRLRYNILTPLWVALLTSSWVGQTYLATQGYGGTKIQLSLDDVANLLVTVPPKSEQAVIISFLFDEVGKFDRLVDEAQIAITLLQERRAALISAAVTGKIDVRRLVSTETEAP
jgi:type I restriction enzyme S subunit